MCTVRATSVFAYLCAVSRQDETRQDDPELYIVSRNARDRVVRARNRDLQQRRRHQQQRERGFDVLPVGARLGDGGWNGNLGIALLRLGVVLDTRFAYPPNYQIESEGRGGAGKTLRVSFRLHRHTTRGVCGVSSRVRVRYRRKVASKLET